MALRKLRVYTGPDADSATALHAAAQPNTVRYAFAFTVVDRDDVAFDLLDTAVAVGNIYQTVRRKL